MKIESTSLRSFIGSKDYDISRKFYKTIGFEEVVISHNLCLFKVNDTLSFYLQDAYVKDWIENTMLFWEVSNLNQVFENIKTLSLEFKFKGVKVSNIVHNDWGDEFFVHDPAGILWHIGEFSH